MTEIRTDPFDSQTNRPPQLDELAWCEKSVIVVANRHISNNIFQNQNFARSSDKWIYVASILGTSEHDCSVVPIIQLDMPKDWTNFTWIVYNPSTKASYLGRTIKDINSLKSLPYNWDSYGAAPIGERAISKAVDFILDLINETDQIEGLTRPIVVPCPDGSMQLEWDINDKELEVGISDSDGLSFEYLSCSENYAKEDTTDYLGIIEQLKWLLQRI